MIRYTKFYLGKYHNKTIFLLSKIYFEKIWLHIIYRSFPIFNIKYVFNKFNKNLKILLRNFIVEFIYKIKQRIKFYYSIETLN